MARRKRNLFRESAILNKRLFNYYVTRFSELALSVFEWENLPDTIDPRFLELTLYMEGQAVFFYDKDLGYLALQCLINGPLNVYRIPIRRRAFSVNGYQKDLTIDDSVIIWNNRLHTNTSPDMELYALRISDIDRTIDVNARAQKTPVLIQCSEEQRLTLLNVYKEYDGNAPAVFADKSLDMNGLTVLKTDAPFMGNDLYQLKTQIWNEALTYLGISNLTIQKKERVNIDEVSRSLGGTIASRYARLEARKQACEEINRMFGLNISVRFKDLDEDGLIEDDAPEESEVEEDEQIYD